MLRSPLIRNFFGLFFLCSFPSLGFSQELQGSDQRKPAEMSTSPEDSPSSDQEESSRRVWLPFDVI